MPFKDRLAQAIRDEEIKALESQAYHVAWAVVLALVFIVIVGTLAVRLIHAPSLFGGGMADVAGYGGLALVLSLRLTKHQVMDRWLETWYQIRRVCDANIAKIEATVARLDAEAQASAPQAGEPAADPWRRALAAAPSEPSAADNRQHAEG